MSKPRIPANLGTKGRKFWADTTGTYEFRPDELCILEDACRTLDLVDKIEEELETADLVTTGSMGQEVAHPLLSEVRQHRTVFARLAKQLALPDEGEAPAAVAGSRSAQARDAVNSRWKRGA